jgi:hypothetical protein
VTVVLTTEELEFVTVATASKLSIVKDIARIFIGPPKFPFISF